MLIISFIFAIESFETELFLGFDRGIRVFSTAIYENAVMSSPAQYQKAMALSASLFVMAIILIIVQWRIVGQREYTTVTGKGYVAQPIDIGRWRYVACGLILTLITFSIGIPLAGLVLGSFMKVVGYFQAEPFTLEYWKTAFGARGLMDSLKNTIILATFTATATMVLCSIIAYIVVKTKFKERKALDLIAWLPWGVPRMVLALGMLWAFLMFRPTSFLYGTMAILGIALGIKALPLGTRIMSSTMLQVHREMEESAWVHGASQAKALWKILVPLLLGAFLSGWIMIFALAAKNLSTVVLLYGPQSRVLSVLVFENWQMLNLQVSVVMGLIQTGILLICYLVSTKIASRLVPTSSAIG
jgi:iron(III) transport system permease protein